MCLFFKGIGRFNVQKITDLSVNWFHDYKEGHSGPLKLMILNWVLISKASDILFEELSEQNRALNETVLPSAIIMMTNDEVLKWKESRVGHVHTQTHSVTQVNMLHSVCISVFVCVSVCVCVHVTERGTCCTCNPCDTSKPHALHT